MKDKPEQHPDLTVWEEDLPFVWGVDIQVNGDPTNGVGMTFSAPVTDDGRKVGELEVDLTQMAGQGTLELTLTQELWDLLGRYSTWRIREDTMYRRPLVQGRIVKAV